MGGLTHRTGHVMFPAFLPSVSVEDAQTGFLAAHNQQDRDPDSGNSQQTQRYRPTPIPATLGMNRGQVSFTSCPVGVH